MTFSMVDDFRNRATNTVLLATNLKTGAVGAVMYAGVLSFPSRKKQYSDIEPNSIIISGETARLIWSKSGQNSLAIETSPDKWAVVSPGVLSLDIGYRNTEVSTYALYPVGLRQWKFGLSSKSHYLFCPSACLPSPSASALMGSTYNKASKVLASSCPGEVPYISNIDQLVTPKNEEQQYAACLMDLLVHVTMSTHSANMPLPQMQYVASVLLSKQDEVPNESLETAVDVLNACPWKLSYAPKPDVCVVRAATGNTRSKTAYLVMHRGNLVGYMSRSKNYTRCGYLGEVA